MKLWIVAGAFTAVSVPFAAAAEVSSECQVDEVRRAAHVRIDGGGAGGSAPPPRAEQPQPRDDQVAQREPVEAPRPAPERRRNGKRIPDAELIGPRGAL